MCTLLFLRPILNTIRINECFTEYLHKTSVGCCIRHLKTLFGLNEDKKLSMVSPRYLTHTKS